MKRVISCHETVDAALGTENPTVEGKWMAANYRRLPHVIIISFNFPQSGVIFLRQSKLAVFRDRRIYTGLISVVGRSKKNICINVLEIYFKLALITALFSKDNVFFKKGILIPNQKINFK